MLLVVFGVVTATFFVLRLTAGPEWSGGGLLAARAALADVERAL